MKEGDAIVRSRVWLKLAALTALYVALIAISAGRPLWFDELLTYYIARTGEVADLIRLSQRWDLNPPLLHLLAHASLAIWKGREVALRLPSIVEFYVAGLFLFWYAHRKAGPAIAPLSVLILWSSPAFPYATEARPYALLCFWCSAVLLAWDYAAAGERRALAVAALAVANIGLLSSHVFAPFTLLAFVAAEAYRWFRSGKPDVPVALALCLPGLLVFTYVPFYESFRAISYFPPAFQASPAKAASFYWHDARSPALCFLCALAGGFLARARANRECSGWRVRRADYVVLGVFFVIPVLLDLVLMAVRAPFWGRYSVTSEFIFSAAVALLVAILLQRFRWSLAGATIALLVLVVAQRIALPLYRQATHPVARNAAVLEGVAPDLPLVAASGLTFVEMAEYEDRRTTSRLFYLQDRAAAVRIAHATMFDDLQDFQSAFGLRGTIESYRAFVQDHPRFLVLGTADYPEDWLLRKLAEDGASVEYAGRFALPYKDQTLYRVAVKGHGRAASGARLGEEGGGHSNSRIAAMTRF